MKNFLGIFFLIPLICLGQPKIEGLGIFKIGKTTTKDLTKVAEEQHQYFTSHPQPDSNVAVYSTVEFDFGGTTTRNLSLYFYKDTLYGVGCNPSYDLLEALSLKYGAPVKKTSKETIYCRTGLKITYSEVATSTVNTYTKVAHGIEAVEYSGTFFTDKCEKMGLDTLSIESKKVAEKVATISLRRYNQRDKARIDSLKRANSEL